MNNETVPAIDTNTSEVSQESKNLSLLLWILTTFFGLFPALILFFVKADNAYVKRQSIEALNWNITAILAYIVATLLSFIVIGVLLMPIIGICHLVFCIMGTVACSKGKDFKVPFALRLIK